MAESNFFEDDEIGDSNNIDDFFDEDDERKFREVVGDNPDATYVEEKPKDKLEAVDNFDFIEKKDNNSTSHVSEIYEQEDLEKKRGSEDGNQKEEEINIRDFNPSLQREGEFSGLSDEVIDSINYSREYERKSTVEKIIESLTVLKFKDSTIVIFLISLLLSFEIILGISGVILERYFTFGFCVALFVPQSIWFTLLYLQNRIQVKERANYKNLVESFSFGFFGESIVFIIEWIVFYSIIFALTQFFDYIPSEFTLYFLSFASIIFISFFIEGLLEEAVKYLVLYRNSKSIARQSRYSIIRHAITISLAISLFSSTVTTVLIYWMFGLEYAIATLFLEAVLSNTIQIITGIWIALGFIKQYFRESHKPPYPTYQVFLIPVFIHGCYSCFISSIRVLYGISEIRWRLYVAVVLAALVIIFLALAFTLYKVQKVVNDANLYTQVEFFPQNNTSLIIEDEIPDNSNNGDRDKV